MHIKLHIACIIFYIFCCIFSILAGMHILHISTYVAYYLHICLHIIVHILHTDFIYILCILCISSCILFAYFFTYSVAYLAYWQECIFYIFRHMLHIIFIFICILLCIFCIYMINMHMQIDFDNLKCISPGLHCLLQLLLGPPSQGPGVHVPPPTTITTVQYLLQKAPERMILFIFLVPLEA